jgi:hypothetical protein
VSPTQKKHFGKSIIKKKNSPSISREVGSLLFLIPGEVIFHFFLCFLLTIFLFSETKVAASETTFNCFFFIQRDKFVYLLFHFHQVFVMFLGI